VLRIFVVFTLASLATAASAQTTEGVIFGTITDAQGGVLPGASVTVRNTETGVVRTTVTEADGQYRVPALLPGTYEVSAELQGFSTTQVTGLTLQSNQQLRRDVQLQLSSVAESVTVTADAPTVDTTSSEVSAVITEQQIDMLPVQGLVPINLTLLLPGTSQDGSRPRRNNAQVGAGTLQFTTNALADGTHNMSTKAGEPRQDFPQPAVREIRVIQSMPSAEFGGRAGGVVSVITRGGTNTFDGEAYEYFRNKSLSRLDVFQQAALEESGEERPDFSRHQFGGALGGPILRDRLHFFVAAEDTEQVTTYRVVSGQAEFYGKYEGLYDNETLNRLFFGRVDSQLTNNQNLFARWGYQGSTQQCDGCGGDAFGGATLYIQRDSLVVGHTTVMGSRFLNEFRFQWGAQHHHEKPFGAPDFFSVEFNEERARFLQTNYIFPSFSYAPEAQYFNHNSSVQPEFRNDFSIAASRHNVKLGFAYQNLGMLEDQQGDAAGAWTFGVDQPFDHENPAILAGLRNPIQFTASFPHWIEDQAHNYYQFYVQDEWRPRSNLTVNLGLRYEVDTEVWNKDRDNNTFYPRPLPFVDFASRGDNNNWSPRVGVVWDVADNGQTVLRAGAGRLFNAIMNGTPGNETGAFQQFSINIRNPTYPDPYGGRDPISFASTAPPNISIVSDELENPYSDMYTVGFSRELGADIGLHVDGVVTDSEKFNAQVRINPFVSPTSSVRVLPEWGIIQETQSIGWQKYRALLVRLDKRFSNRNQYTVSYTLSKVRDNSFGGTSTGAITDAEQPELDEGYGNADRRHALVASGAVLLPGEVTLGGVWTIRSNRPFSARAGRDLNRDGANTDYVPGTHKGQGSRDLDIDLINVWRAENRLGPISEDQIDGDDYNRFDMRASKAIGLGGDRTIELIAQVFNLFGRTNLGGIGVGRQLNSLSNAFGQILGAQPRQEAEFAIRFRF
jgi:outer membrane receptor for ferrienterochelin and colicin